MRAVRRAHFIRVYNKKNTKNILFHFVGTEGEECVSLSRSGGNSFSLQNIHTDSGRKEDRPRESEREAVLCTIPPQIVKYNNGYYLLFQSE